MNFRTVPVAALLLAGVISTARAQTDIAPSGVLYTTFGSNYSYAYSVESRQVSPSDYVAMPLVPAATATLSQIIVPVYNLTKPDEIRFTLATDSNGVPGAALETWLMTNLVFGALSTNESVQFPVLTNGAPYWLVASVDSAPTQSYWWLGPLDGSIPADNLESHDGGAMWTETTDTDCAFEVDALNPAITNLATTATSVSLTVINGYPGRSYTLLSGTSLGAPLSSWTPLVTNAATTNGPLTLSANVALSTNSGAQFYAVKLR